MKTLLLLLLSFICLNQSALTQVKAASGSFQGAPATLKKYRALYFINESDEKKVRGIIRNINNALTDPRLKGKLEVELVAFGDGVEMFKRNNHYDTLLLTLQDKGVILAQCENTIRERKISKEQLLPFISYVPSGNGEIIIRQSEGWAVIHP
jgi:intracellular sulfur oxidation DsrE/DsrF family protein